MFKKIYLFINLSLRLEFKHVTVFFRGTPVLPANILGEDVHMMTYNVMINDHGMITELQ